MLEERLRKTREDWPSLSLYLTVCSLSAVFRLSYSHSFFLIFLFLAASTSNGTEGESEAHRRQKELIAEQQTSLSAKISECMEKVVFLPIYQV